MARKLPKQWTLGRCPKCGLQTLCKPKMEPGPPGFAAIVRTCWKCGHRVTVEDGVDSVLGEWVWDCGNADCCMNFQPHYRSECYTPDEYEAYVAECEGSQNTSGAKS